MVRKMEDLPWERKMRVHTLSPVFSGAFGHHELNNEILPALSHGGRGTAPSANPLFSGKDREDRDSVPARAAACVNTDSVTQSLASPGDFLDDLDHRMVCYELGPALGSDYLRHCIWASIIRARVINPLDLIASIGKQTISLLFQKRTDIFSQKN